MQRGGFTIGVPHPDGTFPGRTGARTTRSATRSSAGTRPVVGPKWSKQRSGTGFHWAVPTIAGARAGHRLETYVHAGVRSWGEGGGVALTGAAERGDADGGAPADVLYKVHTRSSGDLGRCANREQFMPRATLTKDGVRPHRQVPTIPDAV